MRKYVVIAIVVAVVGGAAAYFGVLTREGDAAAQTGSGGQAGRGFGGGGGFPGGPGGGGGPRVPMTVELGTLKRGKVSAYLVVVGNLIGKQTVDIAPRTGGRLLSVNVQLGDPVRHGQVLAKVEDREIVEQVRQAESAQEVSKATIRQREADLKVSELNFERSKNLFQRGLLAKQSLDDAESRYMASVAQFDLSKAQLNQNDSRLQELKINLQNTSVTSPVDGFVGKRNVDPGAMVNTNTAIASVVDISRLRLVANVVEKDLRVVTAGETAVVEVDAYPGEKFNGKIARVSPVLDPATRTATMEVEIPNNDNRLKPGMYARVNLTVEERDNALVIPKTAVVDYSNQRGVWVPNESDRAMFVPLKLGIENSEQIEVLGGLNEGSKFVNNGAGAVRNNDQLVYEGASGGQGGPGRGGPGRGGAGRGGQGRGGAPAAGNSQGQRPGGMTGQPPAPGAEGAPPRKRPGSE